jgi:hypothetical protein
MDKFKLSRKLFQYVNLSLTSYVYIFINVITNTWNSLIHTCHLVLNTILCLPFTLTLSILLLWSFMFYELSLPF